MFQVKWLFANNRTASFQCNLFMHRALYNRRNFLHYLIPILGAFYNNKNYLLISNICYFSMISKLNYLFIAEKILYVIKRLRNGGIMYWKPVRVHSGLWFMTPPLSVVFYKPFWCIRHCFTNFLVNIFTLSQQYFKTYFDNINLFIY